MLVFIAGLMVGGALGVIMMCLVTAAGEADRHMEECEYEMMPGKSSPNDTAEIQLPRRKNDDF